MSKRDYEQEWREAVADGHIVSSLEEYIEDCKNGVYDDYYIISYRHTYYRNISYNGYESNRSFIMKNIKELRKILADCLRDLRNDFELIENYSNVTYDVGYMRALCYVLGKDKLGNMISAKFMNE